MNQQNYQDAQEYIEKLRGFTGQLAKALGHAPRCFVLTFGCQQNEADSEKLAGMAQDMGYELCSDPADADLIAVNTCAIREHAEQKALSIVGQYKHLKAKKPSLIIAVCGCMVAQGHRREDIKHKYPYVDLTFGTASLHRFPELLWQKIARARRIFCPEETEYVVAEGMPITRSSDYRAWVSIMYGCNNFCSYCIVPYVRGRERSRDKEEIIAEVRELVAKGYKDITLLGQNVNSYAKGKDYDFADLLSELDKIEGDFILRFMTSHPKDASYKLIDVMASSTHVAHQFHLPLQSGSDAVLKAMNRHYDKARYLDIVRYIREKMPDAALSSDIIVGFPGETDADFEDTMEILDTVRFDMLFSFIYSPRKGTPAAEKEQIDPKIKGERFDRLLALQHDIALEKNQPMVGKVVRVLCDGPSKNNPAVYSGREEGNKIVFFAASPEDTGKFVNVKINRADAFALWGEIGN